MDKDTHIKSIRTVHGPNTHAATDAASFGHSFSLSHYFSAVLSMRAVERRSTDQTRSATENAVHDDTNVVRFRPSSQRARPRFNQFDLGRRTH